MTMTIFYVYNVPNLGSSTIAVPKKKEPNATGTTTNNNTVVVVRRDDPTRVVDFYTEKGFRNEYEYMACQVVDDEQEDDEDKDEAAASRSRQPDDNNNDGRRRLSARKLILVLATGRTGSNLFYTLLKKDVLILPEQHQDDDDDDIMIGVGELFHYYENDEACEDIPFWEMKLREPIHRMSTLCHIPSSSSSSTPAKHVRATEWERQQWETQFWNTRAYCNIVNNITSTNGTILQQQQQYQHTPWSKSLVSRIRRGSRHPENILSFLKSIPSTTGGGYVYVKIFPSHLQQMRLSFDDFFDRVREIWKHPQHGEVITFVLWRRRLLESYVSYRIAQLREEREASSVSKNSSSYLNVTSDTSNAIAIDCEGLYGYVAHTLQGYQNIHNAFVRQNDLLMSNSTTTTNPNWTYHIVEYNRELLDRSKQQHIIQRLRNIFLEDNNSDDPEQDEQSSSSSTTATTNLQKQAQVPVESQILNWDEVQTWDRTLWDEVDEWNELFGRPKPPNKRQKKQQQKGRRRRPPLFFDLPFECPSSSTNDGS